MSSVLDRIAHFLRWFFNASPTALITRPPSRQIGSPEPRQHPHSNQQQRVSR
jgi:hypothetical protein